MSVKNAYKVTILYLSKRLLFFGILAFTLNPPAFIASLFNRVEFLIVISKEELVVASSQSCRYVRREVSEHKVSFLRLLDGNHC